MPHVEQFVADIRKESGGHVPTARTWFGYAAIWTYTVAAEKAKSIEAIKLAKAMQGLELPPEVALMPEQRRSIARAHNQLMPDAVRRPFAARRRPAAIKEDLFKVDAVGQGHRRRAVGEGNRLQAGLAELISRKIRAPRFIPRRPNFLKLGLRISLV